MAALLFDLLLSGRSTNRKAQRLLRRGKVAAATIVGIRYRPTGGGADEHHGEPSSQARMRLAVEVHADPSFVAGVEFDSDPLPVVRLGETVTVRHRSGRATIAEDGLPGRFVSTAPAPCKPPARGVDDNTLWNHVLRRNRDLPASITLIDINASAGAFRSTVEVDAHVNGAGFAPFASGPTRLERRPYANHLERRNQPLPGWARPGKKFAFVIDWASAAAASPGTERVHSEVDLALEASARSGDAPRLNEGPVAATASPSAAIDVAQAVPFDTWATVVANIRRNRVRPDAHHEVAASFGISPQVWAEADRSWKAQVRSQPQLMARMAAIERDVGRR